MNCATCRREFLPEMIELSGEQIPVAYCSACLPKKKAEMRKELQVLKKKQKAPQGNV